MFRTCLSKAALACLIALPASAMSDLPVEAELLPGWREDERHIAGLRLTLDPGWKTYWRAPGDAGIPPVLDWSRSENLGAAELAFPVPDVFDVSGLRTIGYKNEVIFPLILTPLDLGEPIAFAANVQLGVCEDICIPVAFTVSAILPATATTGDARLAAAYADRPIDGGAMTCRISAISDGLRLEVDLRAPEMRGTPEVVIETADPSVWVSEPEMTEAGGRISAVAELVPPEAVPFALERDGLRVTLLAGGEAVELRGCD